MEEIDFVIPWVDGSDPAWRAEKARYQTESSDALEERYRDWGLLRYWFRGVEECAPWVRKVHFVTWGHVPEWLNRDNPKLQIVNHKDFIPEKYLPTFSPRPIELNFHRISGLSENFVFFNDDMFLTRPCEPLLFFRNGLPVHPAVLKAIVPLSAGMGESRAHVKVNMMGIINRHYSAKESLKDNRAKWFFPWKTGFKAAISNVFNSQYICFPGFADEHLPVPMKRSVMEAVWKAENETLDATCTRKFRDSHDVTQYLFRYWDLASGEFEAIKPKKLGCRRTLAPWKYDSVDVLQSRRYTMVCLNDGAGFTDNPEAVDDMQSHLTKAFESVFPAKSSFEV